MDVRTKQEAQEGLNRSPENHLQIMKENQEKYVGSLP